MDFDNINFIFYAVAYFMGAIPFGLVLAKIFAKIDIRSLGSHNIGATNVLRVVKQQNAPLAKKLSLATFILDAFKGAIVLMAAYFMQIEPQVLWAIAFLALMGHCVNVFLLLEGGKGVATLFGILLFLYPIFAVISVIVWFGLLKVFKKSSLSSVISLNVLVALIYFFPNTYNTIEFVSFVPIALMYFVVMYKHIDNILNMIKGTESNIV